MNRVIDLHAHVVLEEVFGTASSYGPELGTDEGLGFFRVGKYVLKPTRYRELLITSLGPWLGLVGVDVAR